jgi:glucose-6-phosphate isomerase
MQESIVSIDYALAMAEGVGAHGGLRDEEFDAERTSFGSARKAVAAKVSASELGFWNLPKDRKQLEQVRSVRAGLPEHITDVLVLGIGGSSLGARAIHQALSGPIELAGITARTHARLHFPDNSDPWFLAALLDALTPSSTAALLVSKSGGTVETAAQLLVIKRWLESAIEAQEVKRRIVAITDPAQGSLRTQAAAEGWATLSVPPNVGGRFSLLSPVGLLPALLGGVDVDELLEGAEYMAGRCGSPELRENPAGVIAAVHVLQHRLRDRSIHVMMPYSDRLRPFAAWYVQLWAESLGKRINRLGQVVELGPTPIAAVGATDQHAQMQLFMEGPRDKLITFLRVAEPAKDLVIPHEKGPTAYLGGSSLHDLLEAEREGTTQALANDGRPSITVSVERLDAFSLGALFFLYEAATAFAGELYNINAFDQPGVELGKNLAYGLLGREGYERTAQEVRTLQAKRPKRYQWR